MDFRERPEIIRSFRRVSHRPASRRDRMRPGASGGHSPPPSAVAPRRGGLRMCFHVLDLTTECLDEIRELCKHVFDLLESFKTRPSFPRCLDSPVFGTVRDDWYRLRGSDCILAVEQFLPTDFEEIAVYSTNHRRGSWCFLLHFMSSTGCFNIPNFQRLQRPTVFRRWS